MRKLFPLNFRVHFSSCLLLLVLGVGLAPSHSLAGRIVWQKLSDMIADVDVIAEVEVIKIDGTSITFKTLRPHLGEPPEAETTLDYWIPPLEHEGKKLSPILPGSGIETRLKPGSKYIFLFDREASLSLLRVEPLDQLQNILTAGENADPDAKHQAKKDDAASVAQSFIGHYLNRRLDDFTMLYADTVLLMPGHEMLKTRYGLAGKGGRDQPTEVTSKALTEAFKKMFENWPGPSDEKVKQFLDTLKSECLDAPEGDFSTASADPVDTPDKMLHFTVKKGDVIVKIGPPDEDFLLFQFREIDDRWQIVAEYFD